MKKTIKYKEEVAEYYSDLSGKKLDGPPETVLSLNVLIDIADAYDNPFGGNDYLEYELLELDLSTSEANELLTYLLKKHPKLKKKCDFRLASKKQLKGL